MAALIIILPLIASIICGLFNKYLSCRQVGLLTSISMTIATLLAFIVFYQVAYEEKIIHIILFPWLNIADLKVNWAFYVDQLSAIMLVVVTLISTVVHVYSIGYMDKDENLPRFMSYLSLFTACMLTLVTADNFTQLFFGWEGVGVCSYLLIGFWYQKPSANAAAIKAFIANRVGDFAFILGILTIYFYYNTLEFIPVFSKVKDLEQTKIVLQLWEYAFNINIVELICFFLFIGCMGKSAQIGLHIWLPDAMEGPTPVSALIHAATMVTAGVFLLARCSFIFEYAPIARDFIVIIGSVTCLFAAIVALAQNDIKKIIAYSTCSQLGYMILASGLSSYQAGVFHLFTHAFFKAMLFLGAGSVIHGCGGEQDIRKMGGLYKMMPLTYGFFWLGSLAIMGFFPLAGFYSKDLILSIAYENSTVVGRFSYYCGIIAAFCTAVYSTKIIVKAFHGKAAEVQDHQDNHTHNTPHEAPKIMNLPLILLALGSISAGYIGEYILNIAAPAMGYFKDSIFIYKHLPKKHLPLHIELIPTIVAVMGIVTGVVLFSNNTATRFAKCLGPLYKLILNKFYFDELYNLVFVRNINCFAVMLKCMDYRIIDFVGPSLSSILSINFSKKITNQHNGSINHYAFIIVTGLVTILTLFAIKLMINS